MTKDWIEKEIQVLSKKINIIDNIITNNNNDDNYNKINNNSN